MIRFILKREVLCGNTGLKDETFETVGLKVDALEEILTRGGTGENSFDITKLVGVEICLNKKKMSFIRN